MSQNENPIAIEIIDYWHKKSDKEKEYFNKFIALWISFNCFFVAKYFEEAIKITSDKNKGPYESDFLNVVKKKHEDDFTEAVKENKSIFEKFKLAIDNKERDPCEIKDMRPRNNNNSQSKHYTDINSFDEYLDCVYRIRCNLFHGNKVPLNQDDDLLVKTAYNSFYFLLSRIYNKKT